MLGSPREASRTARPPRSTPLFSPRAVAIVGASDDPAKWGHILARRALESRGDRAGAAGQPRRRPGARASPPTVSAAAAATAHGERVDLAVVCVPAAGFVAAVTDAVAAGARALVGITAGLSEVGRRGRPARGARPWPSPARPARCWSGPTASASSTPRPACSSPRPAAAGEVAVLSQSGNLVLDLAGLLADRGLGVSRFVSLGNQADLGVVDLLHACVEHDGTRAVAVYAEDVGRRPGLPRRRPGAARGRQAGGAARARAAPRRRSAAPPRTPAR